MLQTHFSFASPPLDSALRVAHLTFAPFWGASQLSVVAEACDWLAAGGCRCDWLAAGSF